MAKRLKKISIEDGIEFKYNNDVMEQCFGASNSEFYQYATRPVGDGCDAWFPKERKLVKGEWKAGSNDVNWKNYLDCDGKIIVSCLIQSRS